LIAWVMAMLGFPVKSLRGTRPIIEYLSHLIYIYIFLQLFCFVSAGEVRFIFVSWRKTPMSMCKLKFIGPKSSGEAVDMLSSLIRLEVRPSFSSVKKRLGRPCHPS
jgi:hypothetical protein